LKSASGGKRWIEQNLIDQINDKQAMNRSKTGWTDVFTIIYFIILLFANFISKIITYQL